MQGPPVAFRPPISSDPLLDLRALRPIILERQKSLFYLGHRSQANLCIQSLMGLSKAEAEMLAGDGSVAQGREIRDRFFRIAQFDLIFREFEAARGRGVANFRAHGPLIPKGRDFTQCTGDCCREGAPQQKTHTEAVEEYRPDKCVHCGEINELFLDAEKLGKHHSFNCPMLGICKFCTENIELKSRNDHWATACPGTTKNTSAKAQVRPCSDCKLLVSANLMKEHQKNICQKGAAESGERLCSLCTLGVDDTAAGWRGHMIGWRGCNENLRRNKSGVPAEDEQVHEAEPVYLDVNMFQVVAKAAVKFKKKQVVIVDPDSDIFENFPGPVKDYGAVQMEPGKADWGDGAEDAAGATF